MAIDTTAQAVDESDYIDEAPPAPPVEEIEDDEAEAPEPEAEAEAPADEAPAAAEAPAEGEPGAPLTVKVGGKEVAVDGLVQRPDGSIVVPKEHAQAYRDMIRDAIHHRTTFREQLAATKQEVQQEVQAVRMEAATAKAGEARAQKLLEAYDTAIATRIGTPEAAERFLSNYAYEMQLLQRDLQLAQKDVAAIQPELPQVDPLADDTFVQTEVAQHTGELIREHYPNTFGDAEIRAIAQYVQQTARQYMTTADRDYPDLGLKKGDPAVNLAALDAYLRSLAAGRTTVQAADRAAAQNAASPSARTASSPARPVRAASAPPAVSTRAASAAAAPAPAGPPRSRAEWEASLRTVSGLAATDSDFDT